MKDVEYIYHNIISDLCPNIKDIAFYEDEKLVMKICASREISVSEIQIIINAYNLFNISIEFVKYEIIPSTSLCSIEFEVTNDGKTIK